MDLEQRLRVPEKGFRLAERDPADTAGMAKKDGRRRRARDLERLAELQERLYAEGTRSLLIVLQAMDAAGKDGTIAHVMSGLNAQGVSVTSFKQPSHLELAHDFLWRTQLALPDRGDIGVFNRSHYEEVLVVRVHPEYLAGQGIDPAQAGHERFWEQRYQDIRGWERHLARNGTQVIKFFLHISREEQRRRFLSRAEEERKNWKFSAGDVAERVHWDAYQDAYERALRATSTEGAPWYVVPADHKWFLRTAVASIIVEHLSAMDPHFPEPTAEEEAAMEKAVAELRVEG
ncbi:polyphosphate kinase 2 family protein [Baekduia soli]|uniref:Polyphosphate kinase 2 family protein n=1 Tax=Baekduia soli TaxID=496014 RepID=A0A5B8U8T3_9ACTN|nr:polyphosphate kinase 2 family protein [Baekduia soli]QEC49410.1 polyphosphate kinase 2 family protein [Baekduia soli]